MYKYLDIPGWFSMHDAYMNLVKYCEDGDTIVEIGTFAGRGTRFLCDALELSGKHDVKVHGIDTFEGSGQEHSGIDFSTLYDDFMAKLDDHIQDGRLIVHKSRSDNQELLDSFENGSVFGVIVDGAHTMEAVEDDIVNWWPKIKEGGMMFGDDIEWESVKQGTMRGFNKCGIESYGILTGDERWSAQVKGERSKEVLPKLKLIPGMNCMKLNG